MAKVYSPNKEYTGISATVFFVRGVGETDNEALLAWFEEKGYTVEREQEQSKPLEKKTVPELKEYAKLNNIDLGEVTKKEEILEKILESVQKTEQEKEGGE